jgi:arylsulfatase A
VAVRSLLRPCWLVCAIAFAMLVPTGPTRTAASAQQRPPNFIFIFLDDSGYADTSVYGAKDWQTPNIDKLAHEGVRFTNFYVAQAVCSASRVALLTGSYSNRVGIIGALPSTSRIGISDSERLLPQILKTRGYATAIFGKWHLGSAPPFLPTRHGFDEYTGIPYSNDMNPAILVDNEKFVKELLQEDRDNLTTYLTERAVSFIDRNRDRPFFLYLPHHMPHVPLAVSSKFKGKTRGMYGDVMLELDWSVGQVMEAVKRNGLDDNTLVMFSSDNGPWLIYGDHAGSAGPLREGKQTSFEGGVREPFIARWPGHVRPGKVATARVMAFDVLPTLARLAGAEVPGGRIDGVDIWPWMSGQRQSGEPHEALYLYWGRGLEGVVSGRWKLTLPHPTFHAVPKNGGERGQQEPFAMDLSLFDLDRDPAERVNVAADHEDVVGKMMKFVERARDDLGDTLTNRVGRNIRPAAALPEGASPLPDGVVVPPARGRGAPPR